MEENLSHNLLDEHPYDLLTERKYGVLQDIKIIIKNE